ncbi:MAG: methionine adenosyltransferase [Sphaerochaetaceae bacterium]
MTQPQRRFFTSESVSEGHPDKVCDQISDAILDACLAADPFSRVACEVLATTDTVIISGEITTKASLDYEAIVRRVVKEIGYVHPGSGFDAESLQVLQFIDTQSPDIALGVDNLGAGDQGMVFGYACRETPEYMPSAIMFSHKILQQAARLRKEREVPFLQPDAKAQVTLLYEDQNPIAIETVVVSHQHTEEVSQKELTEFIKERVIKPALLPTGLLLPSTTYLINPTGRFVLGGPAGDTGLTGRKIIVDTYGGASRHGGGAFSGKDPTKVDRSGAYMARLVAKNLVEWNVCTRCELQISYAIGVKQPVSIYVDTFGTGIMEDSKIEKLVKQEFDFSPSGIIKSLDLLRPIYQAHMNYGHFGKPGVPWEQVLPKPASL